jgi:hypothetical protein
MAALTLNSFKDVQNLLDQFVASSGVTPGPAPHGVFWRTDADGNPMTYKEFTTGYVPGFDPGSFPPNGLLILVVGNSAASNIVMALQGTGPFASGGSIGEQMPQPSPPYNSNKQAPQQKDVIAALIQWIDAKCPDGTVGTTTA